MKHRFFLLAIVAGSIGLTACANNIPSNMVPAIKQVMTKNSFDLKSADKGMLTLGLDYSKVSRSVQAVGYHTQFVGEVKCYLVKLVCNGQPITYPGGFLVDVNPDGTGKAQATFFNLPAGTYNIYVTAVDKFGVILNKTGQADLIAGNLNVRAHALGNTQDTLNHVIELRNDHVNLPKSLIETSLTAISQLYAHCGEPLQTSLIPKRSPEWIDINTAAGAEQSLVRDTDPTFDDESHLGFSDASIQALIHPGEPPYAVFITDKDGNLIRFAGAYKEIITTRTVDTPIQTTLDTNAPRRVLRLDLPGIGLRNFYLTDSPNNILKAVSNLYQTYGGVPTKYARIDPELVSTTELFYSARYPNGVQAKRYLIVDPEGNNWNIWTLEENNLTKIIGMALPFVDDNQVRIAYVQLLPNTPSVP